MPQQDNNLVTPTYQDVLILNLNTIITRMMLENYRGAWIALKTLYHSLPPKCEEDIKDSYERMNAYLREIPHHVSDDPYFKQNEITTTENDYLATECWPFYHEIKDSLFEHGYLVFESNRPPTRESSMRDLEFTIDKALYGRPE